MKHAINTKKHYNSIQGNNKTLTVFSPLIELQSKVFSLIGMIDVNDFNNSRNVFALYMYVKSYKTCKTTFLAITQLAT